MNVSPISARSLLPLVTGGHLSPLVSSGTSAATGTKQAADAKKAASQFEAIILRQLLKPSIEPMMSGGLGGSGGAGGGIYAYMLTDTLANSLSAGGGLGLSSLLEKQFTQAPASAGAAKPSS